MVVLYILGIVLFVIALSAISLFGPWWLIVARVYCYEAFDYLKQRKEKGLTDKISLAQLHKYITKESFEYDWTKDCFIYQCPIFSHGVLIFFIIKDIFTLIGKIFKYINKTTKIFTWIWKSIKFIFQNIWKFILFICRPFILLKNEIMKKLTILVNVKFI